jgi:hypothetical protein
MNTKDEIKTTNEKPVSLAPLDFKKALEALLKVKPAQEDKEKKDEERKEKPSG